MTSRRHRAAAWRHRVALAALAALPLPLLATPALSAAPPVVSPLGATLTATSIDVTGLVFVAVTTLTTSGAAVPALQFDATTATLHGMVLTTACAATDGGGSATSQRADGDTTAAQGMTLYARDLRATVGGSPVHFSATDPAYPPPAPGTTLLPSGTLASPVITLVAATAPGLTVAGSTVATVHCTP